MSFVERNKTWVLPLLGVAALGVVYMNVQMLKPKPKAATVSVGPTTPSPSPAAAPTPAPLAPTPTEPAGPIAPDLWSDLRALEEPWSGLNQPDALLQQGGHALKPDWLHPGPPVELPSVTLRVPEPVSAAAVERTALPAPPSIPPPDVDFLIQNPKGSSAWLAGSGFKVGQVLAGGWKVRRITPDMVEVEGQGGVVRRWTNPLKARISPKVVPQEAP